MPACVLALMLSGLSSQEAGREGTLACTPLLIARASVPRAHRAQLLTHIPAQFPHTSCTHTQIRFMQIVHMHTTHTHLTHISCARILWAGVPFDAVRAYCGCGVPKAQCSPCVPPTPTCTPLRKDPSSCSTSWRAQCCCWRVSCKPSVQLAPMKCATASIAQAAFPCDALWCAHVCS